MNSKDERKIMDYQTHMFKLIPILATAYAYHFSKLEIIRIHSKLMKDIKSG